MGRPGRQSQVPDAVPCDFGAVPSAADPTKVPRVVSSQEGWTDPPTPSLGVFLPRSAPGRRGGRGCS